jgi:hypothetical protein
MAPASAKPLDDRGNTFRPPIAASEQDHKKFGQGRRALFDVARLAGESPVSRAGIEAETRARS